MTTLPHAGQRPFAILLGLDTMQGLQAARILARHHIPIIATYSDPHHPNRLTNTCHQTLLTPSEADLLAQLRTLGPTLPQKAVLFPCQDSSVYLVSQHRQELAAWYHIALPDHDTLSMLMDKLQFYDYAIAHGLPVPQTYVLRSEQDATAAAAKLTFPCILKPPYRSAAWSQNSSLKAFKVTDADHLRSLYRHYSQWADLLIAQQWIEGDETTLYSCNCYFDKDSNPLVTFVARKLRQWPPQTGQSSLGESCYDQTVLAETIKLFRAVGYHGLGYVEFKRDANTGEYFIVEPNIGRPTGRSAIAEGGNVALLYTMYCDLIGEPLPPNREQDYQQPVKWVHLRRDLQSALYYWRHGELTVGQWWASLRGKKAFAVWSWGDKRPFFADILRTIQLLLSTKERNKRTQ